MAALLTLARAACTPPIIADACKTAGVVGLILNLINHGEALANGMDVSWGNVALDFIVPFCVSSYSAARAACGCGETADATAAETARQPPEPP